MSCQLSKRYLLLVGENGIGKTTLIQRVTESFSDGIIYVSCPQDPLLFGQAFADSISYSSIYSPSMFRVIFSSLDVLPSSKQIKLRIPEYRACQKKFLQCIEQYKKNTGRTPILVIDDVNNFCRNETSKEFLLQLQGYAKECAVSSCLVLFKSKNDHTLLFL